MSSCVCDRRSYESCREMDDGADEGAAGGRHGDTDAAETSEMELAEVKWQIDQATQHY